jgi:hypothetical protein
MSLEQLLPGGLYKQVREENYKLIAVDNSKIDKFLNNVISQFEACGSEFVRDLNYLMVPLILSSDSPPERKALGVLASGVLYTLITYSAPLIIRGRNHVLNRCTEWINNLNKK